MFSSREVACLGAGVVVGGCLATMLLPSTPNCLSCPQRESPPAELPDFAKVLHRNKSLRRVRLREWEDTAWRASSDWKGRDLCHNPDGQAVRVLDYFYDVDKKELTGIVWFGPEAESHRGLCHGGAMTSLMDDMCGHGAFISCAGPWSGATVQVNVELKKPVPVGSVLRIVGRVSKQERRKVHIEALLDDGTDDKPVVYAKLEGLSIYGVKISDLDDAIAARKWEDVEGVGEKLIRQDSGWAL